MVRRKKNTAITGQTFIGLSVGLLMGGIIGETQSTLLLIAALIFFLIGRLLP